MKFPWNFNVHPAQRNVNHHFVWTSIVKLVLLRVFLYFFIVILFSFLFSFFLFVKYGNAFILILNAFFNNIGQQKKKEEKNVIWSSMKKEKRKKKYMTHDEFEF